VVSLDQLTMQADEVLNNAPYAWLEMVCIVATKHIEDTAKLMEDVKTENSGRKIGTDIRNERIDKDFFRTVVNTSEDGLISYVTSKNDQRKLKDQKDRVVRALGAYQRQLNIIGQRQVSLNAFNTAIGKETNTSNTTSAGTTGGSTNTPTTSPLGPRL